MLKTFQIDYTRSALQFALLKNRENDRYFNDTDISIISFFEHLSEEDEVNRYVETFKDLATQQNKTHKIGAGILTCTDNPTIVNNKSCFISPFEWACTIRVDLNNRDKMLETLYKIMEEFRGKKVDIALLDNGKLQPVGTIGNSFDMKINDYDFIGNYNSDSEITSQWINSKIAEYVSNYGFQNVATKVFVDHNGILELYIKTSTNVWEKENTIVPQHTSFEKMKLDISFTDIKMQQPYTLNGEDYCTITFGGGATLTTNNIRLGNDLVKVFIKKNKVVGGTNSGDFTFTNQTNYMLDPIEKGSGNSANSIENKLKSNFMVANSHTDSVAITHEYTFAYDSNISLLVQWFEYANFGLQHRGVGDALTNNSMTPNIIYTIEEYYSNWGTIKKYQFSAKIVEDIDIGNTDSDVMTIKVAMQLQGANN